MINFMQNPVIVFVMWFFGMLISFVGWFLSTGIAIGMSLSLAYVLLSGFAIMS